MNNILLIGAALNLIGGCGIILSMLIKIPFTFPVLPLTDKINPHDYILFRLFTSGAALTFASIYIYLYLHPDYVMPILVFGMALKYWAFLASLFSFIFFKLPKNILINFGLTNLAVAILFTYYLLNI